MSFETRFQQMADRFVTEFGTSEPNVEVLWDNVQDDDNPNAREEWVRVAVNWGDSRSASMPARRYRTNGVFQVQVFVPKGSGTERAYEIGDNVRAAMQGVNVSGVRFRATSLRRVGVDERWFQINANTPFQFDDNIT